ncbi:MAG: hypothetical protein FWG70_11520 [Oscillospiraceae bacterium]|nr:hypothetical protein [Oscillospiraceae bacterium]
MGETISTNTLPEVLFRMIKTEKVRLYETDGEIRLSPVKEQSEGKTGVNFSALKLQTKGIKFDRELANER